MRIVFSENYNLREQEIKFVQGVVGLYFIYLERLAVPYPFSSSRLIYIGMSESRQNSIGLRLRGHLTGQSGNLGIRNYAARHSTKFSYYSLDVLRRGGTGDLFQLESFFLRDFQAHLGCFPICNGQAGIERADVPLVPLELRVDWRFFDESSATET
ncbi:GIY-YIG nuclease family protein [Nitratireductor mangrovi]|uniref:GIY-YIG nuclease family protein n=1 Tax=Nitratireductor mangrovi TaxID=2599600 RepID=A0A5B8KWZ9_9HYPH|nr:GIY-YIG nuclease family protein [Nitratireductor mangrovi]QDZ00237.1 GIY-YIG nuclease family protein [Nitratireductor mangrovi]